MNLRFALLAAAVFFSTSASGEETQFVNGQAVSLSPDRAYILVRTIGKEICGFANIVCVRAAPLFIRALSGDELDQANALAQQDPGHWKDRVGSNVVVVLPTSPYAVDGDEETLLASAKPGTYVLGGVTLGFVASASLCMGTVKFEAKPDVITDLGTIVTTRDDEPTDIPELSNYVAGRRMGDGVMPEAVAIRPATPTTDVPQAIKSLPLIVADFRAVRPFPNYLGAPLMRLAPLVGVLAYGKDGEVIDLKASDSGGR